LFTGGSTYGHPTVTAIDETIKKRTWEVECWRQRQSGAMKMGDRLDNHAYGPCRPKWNCIVAKKLVEAGFYTFEYDEALSNITIEKGSIP
jgi:riboflavin synthase